MEDRESLLHTLSNHDLLYVVLFVLVVAVIVILFRKKPPLRYRRVQNLFTPSERKFYFALQRAVGDRYLIFAKVRAADLLLPISAKDRSRWQSAFNKVACKHFDYVLCDEGLEILAAIELDDASHTRADRIERDRFIEWACKSAKLPLIRVKTAKHYDAKELRSRILREVGQR